MPTHARRVLPLLIGLSLASSFVAVPFAFPEDGAMPGTAGAAAGKAFNPDVSVNFLGYGRRSTVNSGDEIGRTADVHNGFTFQEAEMQFFADVDPYFRANALFSLSPNAESERIDTSSGTPTLVKSPSFALDPEEVFFETTSFPVVTIRAGKFKAALGKHNTLHTHAFPFVDAPLINQDLLGSEGLNETGVSASALLPDVPWFMELTAQALNNSNEILYNSPNAGDVAAVVQLKNLWDLTDNATLEWSTYGTQGKNQVEDISRVWGSDLIYKWRPAVGGKYQALTWANEYMNGYSPVSGFVVGPSGAQGNGDHLDGLASWIQYQFAERWWIQGRGEHEGFVRSGTLPVRNKQSALLAFNPSEFSQFRIQYDHLTASNQSAEHAVTLQWNITIGAHPAHSY